MDKNTCGMKRFLVGYLLVLIATLLLAYSLQYALETPTPLRASVDIDFTNSGNTTAKETEIRF